MIWLNKISRAFLPRVFLFVFAVGLQACATGPITPPTQLEAHPQAITIPYRISEAGHIIIDMSVNGHAAKPFIIDSGANTTAVYENHLNNFGLTPSGRFSTVSGLVATALRPIADNVELQIGSKSFQRDKIVILETPPVDTGAVGLLGVDVLGDYAVVFNKERLTATLIPSAQVDRDNFSGWRRIHLRNHIGFFPDKGLYFATIFIEGETTPVLVDTGSELNFVNWELASEDEEIAKLRKRLRKAVELQGAIDQISLEMRAVYYDVRLGNQWWPEVDVVILEFDTLNEIAPVDEPMMLAGADMFSPKTFAFDFGGNAIYIHEPTEKDAP